MKNILILLLFIKSAFLFSQESGQELIKHMNDVYTNSSSVSMDFVVAYYAMAGQPDPTMSEKGEVRYSGLNYYSNVMGQIVLINKHQMLIIDKTEHTITCLPGKENEKEKKQQPISNTGVPDSSWKNASKIKLLDKDGASRHVEIEGNDPIYEKIVLTINATSYALEEIIYYYKKLEDGSSPKLVVTYSSVKFNTNTSELDFSEKKYVQKKDGKLIATTAWNNYQVIDLTNGTEIK